MMIEGVDYFVRQVDLSDAAVGAAVRPNDDGTFSVYINSRSSTDAQRKALAHELGHIIKEDFYNERQIAEIEHSERALVKAIVMQAQDEHIMIDVADDASPEELAVTLAFLRGMRA